MTSPFASRRLFLLSASMFLLIPTLANAQLIHRYSFSETSGTAISDSVGGAHGIVLGDPGDWSLAGGELTLSGGPSATAPYADLANGLISGLTDVTFEGWATIDGSQNWARLFDFGSNEDAVGGEILGPGGTGAGLDYIILSASRGGNNDQQRAEVRNEDPVGGGPTGTATSDSNEATVLGTPYHFALVFDADGVDADTATMTTYRNGVEVAAGTSDIQLGHINDVNNWLGRSNWTGDANMQGSFDKFRIYDEALDGDAIAASAAAGPNVIVPEPSTFILATLGMLGLTLAAARRRVHKN